MGKRHYTREEIIRQCKNIARENRMGDRSSFTAAPIILCYSTMKTFDFKGQRLAKLCARVDELNNKWEAGELDLKAVSDKLLEDIGMTIEYVPYKESDIVGLKKGSYDYWLTLRQLPAQNIINECATRYMIFYFTALHELYGFGKDRCNRVQEAMTSFLSEYQTDKTCIRKWRSELYENAGIVFEDPVDPLTQKSGGIMTGAYV